jgi:integrase
MRRGELCGLRWSDVNLERGDLEVSRAVILAPGGLAEKTTKTGRVRPVALDEVGVALLVEYRASVDAWARAAGAVISRDSYVFSPYFDGSKPFRPDNVTGFFIRVRDSLGFGDVRLHDLRHFTATQLKMSRCRRAHGRRTVGTLRCLPDAARLLPRHPGT